MGLNAMVYFVLPGLALLATSSARADDPTPAANLTGINEINQRITVSLQVKGADEFRVDPENVIVPPGSTGVAVRSENQEAEAMRCTVCGAELKATRTDLPFKVREVSIVILKNLPVVQCAGCPEYLIEDGVLSRVDEILSRVDSEAELEIIRYAA